MNDVCPACACTATVEVRWVDPDDVDLDGVTARSSSVALIDRRAMVSGVEFQCTACHLVFTPDVWRYGVDQVIGHVVQASGDAPRSPTSTPLTARAPLDPLGRVLAGYSDRSQSLRERPRPVSSVGGWALALHLLPPEFRVRRGDTLLLVEDTDTSVGPNVHPPGRAVELGPAEGDGTRWALVIRDPLWDPIPVRSLAPGTAHLLSAEDGVRPLGAEDAAQLLALW